MGGALGMRQSLHLNLDFYGVLLACLAYSMLCVAVLYTYKKAESEMQSMHTLLCAVCATVRNSSISPHRTCIRDAVSPYEQAGGVSL